MSVALVQAAFASAAVVLSAPFAGQIRAWLRVTFPGRFVIIVAGSVALAIAAAVVTALVRIRDRRAPRYASIAAALAVGTAYSLATATGTPEVDSVERVHFIEYGVVAWLFYRAWHRIEDPSIVALPLLAGVLVGTVEEWFQWFIPVRVGEARDVALNLVAISCGLLFMLGVDPPETFSWRFRRGSVVRLCGVAALVVMVFALFVNAVHLGHEVSVGGVSFRSHDTADGLAALARDRAARWRANPPVAWTRLSREDQYMDEGLWHVRARNTAWATGDAWSAWEENRILERFYAPVLDTPSYVSATGHRWPPEQRSEAESRAAGDRGTYVSHAEPYPVLAWPKQVFWSAMGLLTIALLLPPFRARRRRFTL